MDRETIEKIMERKSEVLDICMKIQQMMFKGMGTEEAFEKLTKGKSDLELSMTLLAFQLLKQTKDDPDNPFTLLTKAISKGMNSINDEIQKCKSSKQFYKIITNMYLNVMMNDEDTKGMPICFMYNKKPKPKIGVVPMTGGSGSPMDHLQDVVYSSSPDAYIFCGEATMATVDESKIKDYKYGDLEKRPDSRDIIAITGNNRAGNEQFTYLYSMEKVDGKWKFDLIDSANSCHMESDKLP